MAERQGKLLPSLTELQLVWSSTSSGMPEDMVV